MKKITGIIVAVLMLAFLAAPVYAHSDEEFDQTMEQFMEQMMNSQSVGSGSFGMMPMMMGGWGNLGGGMMGDAGFAATSIFGWLWVIVWTVNSILIGIVLWKLIAKLSRGTRKR
ncbi:MAG: hypothetical protein ABIG32_02600 [Candidatus Uhrbacteria bacterium]|nr:hypothetical protein [Patescibacteria group bacterium]MBU1907024.1 hypothetical protein [Patescibacteria group bacterium]